MGTLAEIKREDLANAGLVKLMEEYLAKARAGDIQGVLIMADTRNQEYIYARCNIGYEKAIGLCARLMHSFNKEWDRG